MEFNEILENSKCLNDVCRILYNKVNYTNREKVKNLMNKNNINWKEWLASKKEAKKSIVLNVVKN